jgi:MFS family permease
MTAPLVRFLGIHAADELATQILSVALGWYVYSVTHSPMSLAYAGLAQFAPNAAMALIAGHTADRFERRTVIGCSLVFQMLCVASFAAWTAIAKPAAAPVYVLLLLLGAARAFGSPTMSATLPGIVRAEEFPRAVAASTSTLQICTIAGPAVGGLIYAVGGRMVFVVAAALYFAAMTQAWRLPAGTRQEAVVDESMLAGVRYVRSNRLLLALLSLDLFAVLLGGVSALLPIYAKDILAVGPLGLGGLRCAPGVGAAIVGVVLARRSIDHGAGRMMLSCVAGFGVATVVFALSTNFWLSLGALATAGGFDMVSMVIRHTLVQTATPDAMRGRVSSINWVFIGASNELGEFESGAAAALFGTVPAAVLGGLGTLAVVGLWTILFPELQQTADRPLAASAE